jgi:hypothetical protein
MIIFNFHIQCLHYTCLHRLNLVTFEQLLAGLVGQRVLHSVARPAQQLVEVLVGGLDRLVGGPGQAGAGLGVVVLGKVRSDEQK